MFIGKDAVHFFSVDGTRSKNPRMEKNIGSFAAFTFILLSRTDSSYCVAF